ncbi:MAG: cation transporter [Methanobrevibacter sp.]|nr:cation transporter [Methanobrevibacter sp.]
MEEYYSKVRKILRIILVLNLIVTAVKIFYGFQTNILSIITAGYDSLYDGVANLVSIFAIIITSRPPNEQQRCRYFKVETLPHVCRCNSPIICFT